MAEYGSLDLARLVPDAQLITHFLPDSECCCCPRRILSVSLVFCPSMLRTFVVSIAFTAATASESCRCTIPLCSVMVLGVFPFEVLPCVEAGVVTGVGLAVRSSPSNSNSEGHILTSTTVGETTTRTQRRSPYAALLPLARYHREVPSQFP